MKKKFLTIIILILVPWISLAQTSKIVPKKIALTFDADMTSGMSKRLELGLDRSLYNEEIIKILRDNKVPATIFISGLWAETYPEVVKDLASDQLFEIANHSYSHRSFTSNCYNLSALPEQQKKLDITKAQETLFNLTGKKPQLFRFPGGCYKSSDFKLANELGFKVINWDIASGDPFNSNTKSIIKNVLNKAKDGSIVVFHLSGGRYAPKTAEALKVIISELKNRGYEFTTVSDLCKKP